MLEQQPRTIRDAVCILQRLLRPDELEVIKAARHCDLARFHFNHGEYIRNLWVHRGGSPVTARIQAAGGCVGGGDDFSQLVIEALWHQLNGTSFELRESEHYQRIVDKGCGARLAEELWESN